MHCAQPQPIVKARAVAAAWNVAPCRCILLTARPTSTPVVQRTGMCLDASTTNAAQPSAEQRRQWMRMRIVGKPYALSSAAHCSLALLPVSPQFGNRIPSHRCVSHRCGGRTAVRTARCAASASRPRRTALSRSSCLRAAMSKVPPPSHRCSCRRIGAAALDSIDG